MKCAFVFPGQGSQSVGMGKDFYDNTDTGKKFFDKADEILGYKLSEMCFDGSAEELSQTVNTQPALYTVSVIAATVAMEKGYVPYALAGHSAGEYAALCIGGAFSFEDGLRLISKRASFMSDCAAENPGKMAAVLNLDIDIIKDILSKTEGVCVAANINSLVQTVISGDAKTVETVMEKCKEAGAKRTVPLNVSGAFHSPLMNDAKIKIEKELENYSISSLKVPVLANFTAKEEKESSEIKENLINQITGSVRWTETLFRMKEMGIDTILECGNGSVLCGLVKKTVPEIVGRKITCLADFQ